MTPLHSLFWAFGLVVFLLGLQGILYFPLTLLYEAWKRRTLLRLQPFTGRVSAVVPAHNEQVTCGPWFTTSPALVRRRL